MSHSQKMKKTGVAYSIKIKKGWPIQKVFYPTNGTFFLQVEGGITQL